MIKAKICWYLCILILLSEACCVLNSNAPKLLGSFSVSHPGFTNIFKNKTANGVTYDLLISSFNGIPFSTDYTYIVRDIGQYMSKISTIKPSVITDHVTWPNEVAQVPDDVFGKPMVSIADGFLVPFKTKGAVKLVDVSSDVAKGPYVVSESSSTDWFYHKVQWVDMDKDGDLDILTCRAKKPIIGSSKGEMLWLENPSDHSYQTSWKSHQLAVGPDVFFQHITLNSSGVATEFIFTSGYFSKLLSVYYLTSGDKWTDSSLVKSTQIDDAIGEVFAVSVVDVNQDGQPELLVTTNNEVSTGGTVHIYSIPSDVKSGKYYKYRIADYFKPATSGMGKGSPGNAVTIPSKSKDHGLDIILSGDDDGKAYLLTSQSKDPHVWTYNTTVFADLGTGTVGQLAFEDINGDGSVEIFVPGYTAGKIEIYSYTPN